MKRVISLIIIASLLVIFLAVPSYASEPILIDLLDYTSLNEDGSNTFYLANNATLTFPNSKANYKYIDIVVRFNSPQTDFRAAFFPGSTPGSENVVWSKKIDDYTFRWFVSLPIDINASNLIIRFLGGNISPCYAEILSCKVSTSYLSYYDCPLTGTISYGGGDEAYFYYNNYDDYFGVNLVGSSDLNYDKYSSYILINDWYKFDYIDLQLYLIELSLTSLTVTVDGLSVPFTIDYLNSQSSLNISAVNIILDLSSIRKDLDGPLEVCITGNVPIVNRVGRFTVMHSFGLIEENLFNSEAIFFSRIKNFFSTQFSSLSTWISNQTSTLTNSISTSFSNLNSWISNQTSSLTNSISTWGQNIIDVLTPDTDESDSVVDKTQQQAQEMESNNSALQQLQRPDLSTGTSSGDISGIVSPSNTVKYTLFLTRIMNAPILSEVILLSMIFSLAAYVLFGKR